MSGPLVALRALLDDPRATEHEREKHAARSARRFARNYSKAGVSGGMVSAGVALSCMFYDAPWARVFAATGFILTLALLAGASLAPRWREHPMRLVWYNVGIGVIASAATGVATGIGEGFGSLGGFVLPLFWLYGTAVVGARPKQQLTGIALQTVAFCVPVLVLRSAEGLGLFLGVTLAAAAACFIAGLLREAADLRRYVDAYRQQEIIEEVELTNQELELVATNLAQTVDEQLENVVARRKDVQRLHRLLHVQDADRSQELLRALDAPRSGPRTGAERYPQGRVVGGRARIESHVASGGFGDVYLAEDLASREQVIVKVMQTDGPSDPARLKRFVLEAAAASAVAHPAIVRVYHVDVERDGAPFMICERVNGETLRACEMRGAVPFTMAVAIFEAIADALNAIHGASLVHRDIKPDNLMIVTGPVAVRVLDFGVSRWVGEDFALTSANELIGSAGYMAPEQINERIGIGPPADIFAVGMTFYECLAGEHPFVDMHPAAILKRMSEADVPPISTKVARLPERIAELVHAMLALDPLERPTAADVHRELVAIRAAHRCMAPEEAALWLLGRKRSVSARVVSADAPTVAQQDTDLADDGPTGT